MKKSKEPKNGLEKTPGNPRGAGRPSTFKPEYCNELIEHMKQGLSFEAFGGVIGMSKQGLYDWMELHPEFKEAKKLGDSYSNLWWEKKGIKGMESREPFNPTLWIFNMKNRFRWTDRKEITEKPAKHMSDEELLKEAKDLIAKAEEGNHVD